MIDFGNVVRTLRESRKLTQSELARQLGINKSMVSSYESGVRSPSYEVLIKLAGYFNVSMDFMFGFSKDNYINVDGLNYSQIEIIQKLISEFKKDKD